MALHLIVEQCGLAIHLLNGNPGVSNKHMTLAQQPAGHLWFSVAGKAELVLIFVIDAQGEHLHNVAKLDLLLAKLLLVLLQPGLVVLDEEVDGVALRQECRPGRQNLDGMPLLEERRRYIGLPSILSMHRGKFKKVDEGKQPRADTREYFKDIT